MRKTILAGLCLATALLAPALALAEPTIIYITRHGEKAEGKDPELTLQGQARARGIALMLHKVGIKNVFSTATNRTQQTAKPTAAQAGVQVQAYDKASQAAMIEKAKASPGPTLVVGHSNTVPDLVKLFGGAAAPMTEDEYERLYQIIIGDDGKVTTVLLTSMPAP